MATINEMITAEVYHEKDGVYYVKAHFVGMDISGITVRQSKKFEELWVQMPMYKVGTQFRRYIEFQKNQQGEAIKGVLETKARLAVEAAQKASA